MSTRITLDTWQAIIGAQSGGRERWLVILAWVAVILFFDFLGLDSSLARFK